MTCHLVPRIPAPAGAAAAARLAAALGAAPEPRPEKRLLALVTLHNAAADAGSRAAVLLEALGYAKRAGLADILLPVIKAHADGWAAELGLDAAGERRLLSACADALHACTRKPRTAAREAYRLLSKCLATYEVRAAECDSRLCRRSLCWLWPCRRRRAMRRGIQAAAARSRAPRPALPTPPRPALDYARPQGAPAAELPGAVPAAAAVVAEFCRSPDMFTFDLAANPAVAQLGSSGAAPEHRALHRLLTIYLAGTVQARWAGLG